MKGKEIFLTAILTGASAWGGLACKPSAVSTLGERAMTPQATRSPGELSLSLKERTELTERFQEFTCLYGRRFIISGRDDGWLELRYRSDEVFSSRFSYAKREEIGMNPRTGVKRKTGREIEEYTLRGVSGEVQAGVQIISDGKKAIVSVQNSMNSREPDSGFDPNSYVRQIKGTPQSLSEQPLRPYLSQPDKPLSYWRGIAGLDQRVFTNEKNVTIVVEEQMSVQKLAGCKGKN